MVRLLKSIFETNQPNELKRIQSIIDLMPVTISCKDVRNDLRIMLWNRTNARTWGKNKDQVLGKVDSELWPAEIATHIREQDLNALALKTSLHDSIEEQFSLGNGATLWLRTWRIPLLNELHQADFLITISQEITKSKQLEDEIKQQQHVLKSISLNAPCMFYQFKKDANGAFSFPLVSRKARDIFGISEIEMMSDPSSILSKVLPEDAAYFFSSIDESANTLKTWRWEGRFLNRDQKVIWVSVASDPHKQEDGSIVWDGVATDVTETKEVEAKEKEQQARLAAASRLVSLGEMAGAIAHELNTPLSCILMGSEHISESLKESTPNYADVARFADLIKNTTEKMAKIVMGLKTLARSSETDPMQTASIGALVDQTVSFCQQKFQAHDIRLIHHTFETAAFIECKEVEIAQVLVNLLNNAFDAVVETENAWVRIFSTETDEYIRIHIADSGSGIPQEIQSKIFEPFFTTKAPGKGTGLGLSISHKIIERHGGKLSIDPVASTTTFIIQLPKSKLRLVG